MRRLAWAIIGLLFLAGNVYASGNSLFVFLPTQVRATALQERLAEQCTNLDVTVFGRSRDFRKQVQLSNPSAVLSLAPVIDSKKGYEPVLIGQNGGVDVEPYFLVSIDTPISADKLTNKRLGVVDWLGRRGMSQYISTLFEKDIKLKRVVKQEDLLPLLTFGFVEAIFVSKSTYEELKSTSNLNLVIVNTGKTVRLPIIAKTPGGDGKALSKCFKSLDDKTQQLLGVEKWSDS